LSLLRPFERDGTLSEELEIAGVEARDDSDGLTVVVEE
jgi:hypothetical protein